MEEVVLPLIRLLRRHTPLGISVCLGTLDEGWIGAPGIGGDPVHHEVRDRGCGPLPRVRGAGNVGGTASAHPIVAGAGWHVSSGFIAGLPGETNAHRMQNLRLAASLPLCGCSVSPFIPGVETGLSGAPAGDVELTLNCMAWMRVLRPDWVIPAVSALNLSQPGLGYRRVCGRVRTS